MIKVFREQKPDETREAYVMRVAAFHIRQFASEDETHYDEANCDGTVIADELEFFANETEGGK